MRTSYRLSSEARHDLLSIWAFIARDDVRVADRTVERIPQAFQSPARFPRLGHRRLDPQCDEPVLFWAVGSYVVVYNPAPKPIVIVRILHGARDLNALL